MNSGKTSAACRLVRQLAIRGKAVGACKLTGVSLRRDTLQMSDYGAKWAVSFTDAGIVSTSSETAVTVAHGLVRHLAQAGAEVIVAELGDGILGDYGVAPILADRELMDLSAAIIMCANDPVAAWGAKQVMAQRFGLAIDVVSGPTTDNLVGTRFVKSELGLAAINARTHGRRTGRFRRRPDQRPQGGPRLMKTLHAAILGASGYGAGELLRLLVQHPRSARGSVTSTLARRRSDRARSIRTSAVSMTWRLDESLDRPRLLDAEHAVHVLGAAARRQRRWRWTSCSASWLRRRVKGR